MVMTTKDNTLNVSDAAARSAIILSAKKEIHVIMSVFDTAAQWSDTHKGCGAPHQSPINLSRSFALSCDRLCEWKVDQVAVQEGIIVDAASSLGGLKLTGFTSGTPTATFNGEGYTCKALVLFSTSQHSIEGVFGEAELVAYFTNPKGLIVCMSVMVRSVPGDTPSSKFFNAFVPYVDSDGQQIKLGDSWMLSDVIPETPSYYVYEGTAVWPNCTPDVTWVVYSNTVTMDPSDYARLASRMKPARRPIQEVGDRQVFFNDAEGETSPAFAKKDGKVYMRCRRIPKEGGEPDKKVVVQKGGLQDKVTKNEEDSQKIKLSNKMFDMQEQYKQIGGLWGVLVLLTLVIITGVLFFSSTGMNLSQAMFNLLMIIPDKVHTFARLFWPFQVF